MIRFEVLGVPVHIHPVFWVAALAWGCALTLCEPHPVCVLYFGMAVFVCLLVHELGHAVAGRRAVHGEVGVCMSWLGGACCCSQDEPECSLGQCVVISLAGPLAGLLVAVAVVVWVVAAAPEAAAAPGMVWQMLWGEVPGELGGELPELLPLLAVYLLQVSVVWSGLNLLPIYPLDGGLLVHDVLDDTHTAHSISLGVTCLLTMLFIVAGVWALAGLMIVLSYYNYRCILTHTD